MTLWRELCKNSWTDRYAVWVMETDGLKETCIRWGSRSPREGDQSILANMTEPPMCGGDVALCQITLTTCIIFSISWHTQQFYCPFSETTPVSWCQNKSSSGHYGAREDNMGKHTDNLAARHSIRTNQRPTSIIPPIFTPDALPAATLPIYPGLGQAPNMLACHLHTQWFGLLAFH